MASHDTQESGVGGSYVIRPSMLTSWPDCPRRSAARAYPDLIAAAGYALRDTPPHIGAAVGTGVHAAAAYTLQSKVDTGEPGNEGEAVDRAVEGFLGEVAGGATWDETTPRSDIAKVQIQRMVRIYRDQVAPKINPIAVEQRLVADAGGGYELSGQADTLAIEPGQVRDLKTGTTQRVHLAQLGAYSLLARTHGREVNGLVEDFIKRVSFRTPNPGAVETPYPVELAEQVALRRIALVKRDVGEFIAGGGDIQVFSANPMSQLCSDKFCPCWGTAACQEHRGAKHDATS